MPLTGTLSRYIGRQFLILFGLILAVLLGVIVLFEFIEMTRRAADRPEATIGITLQLTLFKLPKTVELLFHFAILFSVMMLFWRLTRSHELVVARSVGVSAWQFLTPVVVLAAVIGILKVTLVNPIGAAMFERYDELTERYIYSPGSSLLELSRSGLWLRQGDADGASILHAERAVGEGISLASAVVFLYHPDNRYRGRIDAATATLTDGAWILGNARISLENRPQRRVARYELPTDLTAETIADSFAAPETMSFWELPGFIRTLEEAGFSSLRHRLHYQLLLSQPLLLAAMVLFGAAFSLRQVRRGGTAAMIGAGVATGFALFTLSDIMAALGVSGNIPIVMAAWIPSLLSTLIGTALLLHFEDG